MYACSFFIYNMGYAFTYCEWAQNVSKTFSKVINENIRRTSLICLGKLTLICAEVFHDVVFHVDHRQALSNFNQILLFWYKPISGINSLSPKHYVKSFQIRSYFWSEYRKIRTRNNSQFGQNIAIIFSIGLKF